LLLDVPAADVQKCSAASGGAVATSEAAACEASCAWYFDHEATKAFDKMWVVEAAQFARIVAREARLRRRADLRSAAVVDDLCHEAPEAPSAVVRPDPAGELEPNAR
jgi:hypothetical protein